MCFETPALRPLRKRLPIGGMNATDHMWARKYDDSLIRDPSQAAEQALRIVERGTVIACDNSEVTVKAQTICTHSDTSGP